MDKSKLSTIWYPAKESYREAIIRLSQQVESDIKIKYKERKPGDQTAFDCLEGIIKEIVEHDGSFKCDRETFGKKILAVHDVERNPILSMFIGPYDYYRSTVLEKLSEKITALIYRTGMKTEVIEIMFSLLLREMKQRFGMKNSGYSFVGVEGNREEGTIKKEDD